MSEHKISFDSPHLTPLKQNNLQYKPTQQEVLSYAEQVLELNLMQDPELIFLAEEALIAPLPQNWQACEYFPGQNGFNEQNGNITEQETFIVYRNKLTKEVVYDHPLDSLYRQKARQLKSMKNTAKYSQNITPISEELIQSSVLLLKNNSKKGNQGSMENNSSQNNYSSNFEESRSKVFNLGNSKAQDLVRNITQESMAYEDEGEFSNLSMITDQGENINQSDQIIRLKKDNSTKDKKETIYQSKWNELQKDSKKIDIKKLKEKPKVIRPIIVPSDKQVKKDRLKQAQRKQALQTRMRQLITKTVLQKLTQTHLQKMQRMNQKIKQSMTLKEIEEKMLIAREYPESQSTKIRNGVDKINKKIQQLKLIERENKALDQTIQELMNVIQFENKL